MAIIHRLDNNIINKIAAGEVVERPASIVKELVENSIDARATAISVEIRNGGISYIRVTDNGVGMDKDDAEAAFLRHATSKIKSMEDLKNIITLGFRGEALSSIAAVSQIELMTRQPGSMSGYNVINHGGKLIQAREIGCPEGTTIVVRNLFYNTPARLKFLNSTRSETAAISDLIAKLIMANPMVSIRYLNNDKTIYHSPGDDQLINCIISIYGKDIKNELIPVKVELDELSITGYIGKPTITRANRTHQSFFVNGRYIKDNMLTRCVEEALKDWMMVNRFPWCVLHIEIQPEK
ncbi:MAG: DNA mismatch repair endonuclease MutL, partial [Caldicoprobacterales bacterium]